jgi:sugar lactone lactonase YvrE
MKRRLLKTLAVATVAATLPVAAVSLASASIVQPTPKEVVTFDPAKGQLPHGIAFDASGAMWVSFLGSGEVMRIALDGTQTSYPVIPPGQGALTGIAIDRQGHVFVGATGASAFAQLPGVYEIADGTAARVMTLPPGSAPSGLAFYGSDLYVADSRLGTIWRYQPTTTGDNAVLWLNSWLLAPQPTVGATGLAAYQGALYAAVSDTGLILRIPVTSAGLPGIAATMIAVPAQSPLVGAYGIAFDKRGNLYVATTSHNALFRVAPGGEPVQLAGLGEDMTYPSMIAFGTANGERQHLYITEAALRFGDPCVMKLDVGVRGLPLP